MWLHSYRHKTFPTQIFRKLLICSVMLLNSRFVYFYWGFMNL